MPNNFIFSYDNIPVRATLDSSGAVYNTFATAPSDVVLWTPATGKRIYLTGVEISAVPASGTAEVTLERTDNAAFLVARFVAGAQLNYAQTFFSPVVFNVNEPISVTSDATTLDVTLFGYEA